MRTVGRALIVASSLASWSCGKAAPRDGGRAVARTAALQLAVDDTVRASGEVESIAAREGGQVAALERGGDGSEDARASLRIPAGNLEHALAKLAALGSVLSERRTAEDVTAPVEDVAARLQAARTLEHDLLQLTERPGATLGDLVAAQGKLGEVREHIESLEAQQRTLDARVALVQVDVELTHLPLSAPLGPLAVATLRGSVHALGTALRGALLALIALAPWAALPLALAVGLRLRRRRAG